MNVLRAISLPGTISLFLRSEAENLNEDFSEALVNERVFVKVEPVLKKLLMLFFTNAKGLVTPSK
ncbi:hypothetical protein D3C80_1771340 [compost metagenome]